MEKKRILVIEDDGAVRMGIVDALEAEGYATHEAADGTDGMAAAVKVDCDLILLDLVMPGPDGLEILGEVRRTRPTLPVIIMTARGEETDRVRGLRLGADDYVVKPFSVRELLARVEAVLRRSPGRPSDIHEIAIPGGRANLDRAQVCFDDGTLTSLSEREVAIVRYLAINPGRAISRDELLTNVWRINPRAIVQTRTIDMHVARLREKLRDAADPPHVILTVRGKGYLLAQKDGA